MSRTKPAKAICDVEAWYQDVQHASQAREAIQEADCTSLGEYLEGVGQAIRLLPKIDPKLHRRQSRLLTDHLCTAVPIITQSATLLASNNAKHPQLRFRAAKGRPRKGIFFGGAKAALEDARQTAARELAGLSADLRSFSSQSICVNISVFERRLKFLDVIITLLYNSEAIHKNRIVFRIPKGKPKDTSIIRLWKKHAIDEAILRAPAGTSLKTVRKALVDQSKTKGYLGNFLPRSDEEFDALRKSMMAEGGWKSNSRRRSSPRKALK